MFMFEFFKRLFDPGESSQPYSVSNIGDTTLHHLALSPSQQRWNDYIVAVLVSMLVLLCRALVEPWAEKDYLFVMALCGVVFVSWRSGIGPGIVTLFISMIGMVYFFVPPKFSLVISGVGNLLATVMFFICGVCCAGLGEAQCVARRRAKAALSVALERKAELEVEIARRVEAERAIRQREIELTEVNRKLTIAQEETATALAQIESLVLNAPVGIALLDPALKFMRVNRVFGETTGRKQADLRGKLLKEFVPEFPLELLRDCERVLQTGAPALDRDLRVQSGTDRESIWQMSIFAVTGVDGRSIGLGLIGQNITDRKLAEEAVQRSERNLTDFFENANVGLHWGAQDGTILRANRAELEMLGYSPNEYVGKKLTDFHTNRDTVERILATLKRGERVDSCPAQLRCKDGSIRDVLISCTALLDDGRFVHSRTFTRDITEHKRAEEHLRASESRYRTLTEAIPQLVWNAASNGYASYFNKKWFDYTGLSPAQSEGEGWIQAFHPDDAAKFRQKWRMATAREANEFSAEFRLHRAADDSYRWMLTNAISQRDSSGAIVEWVGSIADIDDQKRQAETLELMVRERTTALMDEVEERKRIEYQLREVAVELSRSNEELEQFAYVASHDLQEPLRKIQAFGDRLRNRFKEILPDLGKEYVERMQVSADRMRRLIDDLLTFSRVTTQARPFALLDLEKLTREVVSDLDESINQYGGRVEIADLPHIHADPTQMRQLFQNLIANAIKFHRVNVPPIVAIRGERVDIPLTDSNGEPVPTCRILVQDNGIGFDEKYLDRIFQVFQRLHGRDEYEGTGVGLAICRKIAERHGGAIAATSRVGEGSTFIVTLPIGQSTNEELSNVRSYQEISHDPDGRR
jgi:PAS domain S-box-containing protein